MISFSPEPMVEFVDRVSVEGEDVVGIEVKDVDVDIDGDGDGDRDRNRDEEGVGVGIRFEAKNGGRDGVGGKIGDVDRLGDGECVV